MHIQQNPWKRNLVTVTDPSFGARKLALSYCWLEPLLIHYSWEMHRKLPSTSAFATYKPVTPERNVLTMLVVVKMYRTLKESCYIDRELHTNRRLKGTRTSTYDYPELEAGKTNKPMYLISISNK